MSKFTIKICCALFAICVLANCAVYNLASPNRDSVAVIHKVRRDIVYVEHPMPRSYTVTATCYNPTKRQCNSRYWETASQAIIDTLHPDKHRWIAVSRDLLNDKLRMGDTVAVSGTWIYDGLWIIQDKMNARFTNKIDFLIHKNQQIGKWSDVIITRHSVR